MGGRGGSGGCAAVLHGAVSPRLVHSSAAAPPFGQISAVKGAQLAARRANHSKPSGKPAHHCSPTPRGPAQHSQARNEGRRGREGARNLGLGGPLEIAHPRPPPGFARPWRAQEAPIQASSGARSPAAAAAAAAALRPLLPAAVLTRLLLPSVPPAHRSHERVAVCQPAEHALQERVGCRLAALRLWRAAAVQPLLGAGGGFWLLLPRQLWQAGATANDRQLGMNGNDKQLGDRTLHVKQPGGNKPCAPSPATPCYQYASAEADRAQARARGAIDNNLGACYQVPVR